MGLRHPVENKIHVVPENKIHVVSENKIHVVSENKIHVVPENKMRRLIHFCMGWLRFVGFLKLNDLFAKEPCKRD